MGVGGLLMEIPTRPLPREATRVEAEPQVHVVLLAAGRSSRMGGPNKLMALFDDDAARAPCREQAVASKAQSVTVVTGHQADRVAEALSGLDLRLVHNPDFAVRPIVVAEDGHRQPARRCGRRSRRSRRHAGD